MVRSLRCGSIALVLLALSFARNVRAENGAASSGGDPFAPTAVAVASLAAEAPAPAPVCPCKSFRAIPVLFVEQEPGNALVREALCATTNLDFVSTPLGDVANYLGDLHDIRIMLDLTALSEHGLDSDAPVNLVVQGINLQSALALLATQVAGLDYIVRDGVLFVTTQDQAADYRDTRLYDVRSIVDRGIPIDRVIGLLQETYGADGNDDTIANVDGHFLLVRANQHKHSDVAVLLNAFTRRDGE